MPSNDPSRRASPFRCEGLVFPLPMMLTMKAARLVPVRA
jgi:hypothetical protein